MAVETYTVVVFGSLAVQVVIYIILSWTTSLLSDRALSHLLCVCSLIIKSGGGDGNPEIPIAKEKSRHERRDNGSPNRAVGRCAAA